jgi:hypothetical protein
MPCHACVSTVMVYQCGGELTILHSIVILPSYPTSLFPSRAHLIIGGRSTPVCYVDQVLFTNRVSMTCSDTRSR